MQSLKLTVRLTTMTRYAGIGGAIQAGCEERRFIIIEPTVGRTDWQESCDAVGVTGRGVAACDGTIDHVKQLIESAAYPLKHRSPPALRKAKLSSTDTGGPAIRSA